MNKMYAVTLIALAVASSGCAHSHIVEAEPSRTERPEGIKANIGGKEVREGDRLRVFTNLCRKQSGPRGISREVCRSSIIGEARVLKILDDDSSIVEPLNGLVMDSDMHVERK